MRNRLRTLAGLVALSLIPSLGWAAARATPDEAKAMAVKAAAYLQSVGPEKAFAAFNQPTGPWHDRELYVAVLDANGTMMANGSNSGLIGKSVMQLRDVEGKPFVRELLATKEAGWVEFKWRNPVTKAVQSKEQYEVKVGNYFVGVGAFTK